jgi:hypothetical protein
MAKINGRNNNIQRKCAFCHKVFHPFYSTDGVKTGIFCSSLCSKKYPFSEERKSRLSISRTGAKNPMWKGDKASYYCYHEWARNHKVKSEYCELCGCKRAVNRNLDLANLSGMYLRDVNDYKWLCRRCHMIFDNRLFYRKVDGCFKKIKSEFKNNRFGKTHRSSKECH